MKQTEAPSEIIVKANTCCSGFLENQIAVMQAIKKSLQEFDKETVIKQIDYLLNYYKEKLGELPSLKSE